MSVMFQGIAPRAQGEYMTFKQYREKRVLEIEKKTDKPATQADEGLIEREWEKMQEYEAERKEREKTT